MISVIVIMATTTKDIQSISYKDFLLQNTLKGILHYLRKELKTTDRVN